jgi:20S proteasome subunit alpha 4
LPLRLPFLHQTAHVHSIFSHHILIHHVNRKANAIGRSAKTVREFLERNHQPDMTREDTIKLTIKSLLEVVQTGAKNIEIAISAPGKPLEMLDTAEIEKYVESINTEKQEEAEKKRPGGGSAGASGARSTGAIPSRPAET